MKIKFIGTGSGKSSLKRYHSSFLISSGKFNLLVDTGDGASRALLKQGISFNSIDGILLTHLHADHYSGLASLIVQMKMAKRTNPLKIFIHTSLSETIKSYILHSYLYKEKMNFEIQFEEFDHEEFKPVFENFSFIARQNSHLEENAQLAEESKLSTSCSSFLFKLDEKYMYYTSDIGSKEDLYLFSDFKFDVMITEITHTSFNDIFESIRLLNPKKLFFTHISEENEPDLIKLYDNLPEELKGKIIPAVDGMLFEI